MLNYIKNKIANMFFYSGYNIMQFGSYLHKVFNTPSGKGLVYMEEFKKALNKELDNYVSSSKEEKSSYYTNPIDDKNFH
jgi:hypothetical protein